MDEKQVRKIYAEPFEEEIKIGKGDPIKIWIHPLVYPTQKSVALGKAVETQRIMMEDGAEEVDCVRAGNFAYMAQVIQFCVRTGKERTSTQLFKSGKEVFGCEIVEIDRLFTAYVNAFEMTEEDLGNSLRARIPS